MAGKPYTIKCARCDVPAKTVANPEPSDDVTCPVCGARDKFEDVIQSAGEQAAYHVLDDFQKSLAREFRGAKGAKLTAEPIKRPEAKFIIEL